MATHDYVIANQSGAAFRTDLNNALAAIVSNNSNSSSPATTYAYQWWADTSAGVLKIRNSSNNAWVELLQLDGTLTMEDGSASTPGLAFRDDLNTGIFSSAADTFNIATAGVERMELGATTIFNEDGADVDFRIEGDSEANLFYVDAGNNRIGIGTASPGRQLSLVNTSGAIAEITTNTTGNTSALYLHEGATGSTSNGGAILYDGANNRLAICCGTTLTTERLSIDRDTGNVGIGTSSPTAELEIFHATDPEIHLNINTHGDVGILKGDADGLHLTGNGSSNQIRFKTNDTERMRIDSSGRIGIGTTSPGSFNANADDIVINGSGNAGITISTPNSNTGRIAFGDPEDNNAGEIRYSHSDNALIFDVNASEGMRIDSSGRVGIGTNSPSSTLEVRASSATHQLVSINREDSDTGALFLGCNASNNGIIAANNTDILFGRDLSNSFTERMRLTNDGKLLVNRTSTDGSGMLQVAVSTVGITTATGSQSSTTHLEFRNQSGTVGTIKTSGNNSSFNTSSDYRLKENVVAIADGIRRLKQLKPKKFNWISDETNTLLDGFLAHEVADVIPEAVTGEKDAVDTDGKPIWQQIDHSKLVPLLVSAVQELITKVEILEAA